MKALNILSRKEALKALNEKFKYEASSCCLTDRQVKLVLDAMEEDAKQQSIQFGRTLLKHAETGLNSEKQSGWFRGGKMLDTSEIYEQFKEEKLF